MNALLGEGMSSRLYQTIRENHGLAYSVYSFVNMLSDTGCSAPMSGPTRKHQACIELVHEELERLRTRRVDARS